MTDILDTLKAAVADKDGTDPVELSAEDVYEVAGELMWLRRECERLRQMEGGAIKEYNSRWRIKDCQS